jgi:uncharacterized protein (DUF2267 family)
MARDRLLTAEEFLTLRHKLTEDANTSVLEELHNELASMIVSDPDRAASILQDSPTAATQPIETPRRSTSAPCSLPDLTTRENYS